MMWEFRAPERSSLDLLALKQLVRQGEGALIEFKLKNNHPDKILRELVAFANSNGGTLLLGVRDDREIIGLKFGEEDDFVLQKYIHTHIHPPLPYKNERYILPNEREVLLYKIPSSSDKPHFVTIDEEPKAYIRVADRSIQASKEMREILKGRRKNIEVKFHYGEKEKRLMHYLGVHPTITRQKFMDIAEIPRKMASTTLVRLVLANVLAIEPAETEDQYRAITV
jgi:predicted HTH transcriptional regulator